MAQLNDLLVSGASRLLNGLGILGITNADSIIPNITETYELGSSSNKWKNAYIKTISANDMTLAILTVTNYATIGGGQAATATNTGALRVAGGLSTTQESWFGAGAVFATAVDSSQRKVVFGIRTSTHLSVGNSGIQAYLNNTPTVSKLHLQYSGGDLDIGKSGHTGVTTIYGPLNYAGFSAASDNADRVVWFSYNGTIGRPVYDNDFKYNPSTNRLTLGRLYLTNTEAVSHIQFSRAGFNYITAPSGGSIAFSAKATATAAGSSLVVQAESIIPGENNGTITLGTSSFSWKSLYTRNIYWDDGNGVQIGHTSYTNGTASTTEGTNGTQGYFNLYLGNSTAISSTAGSGAGNSRGRLYIYGTGAYSSNIITNAASSNKTVTIPNYTGYMVIGNNGYTNPTSATTYYIPFYLTAHQRTSANNGLRYRTLEGTADANGYAGIYLGNETASGTAANKYGFIRIYGTGANYTIIKSQPNGDRSFWLGNYAGDMYAVHAGNNNAVGSSTLPVYVAANGRVTACGTSLAVSITGNAATATTATSASYLKDKGNNTATYVHYSSDGMTSASWYGAWDGYTLRAISPANLATHLATTTLDARYALPARLGEYNTSAMTLNTTINGWYYASSGGPFEGYHSGAKDYMVMCQGYSSVWGSQIATDFRSNHLAVRNNNNGTWSSWALMLDTGNYSSYALPITGGTLTGLLKISTNGNTVTIGSANTNWCHFSNSADIPFYFNKKISGAGGFEVYNTSYYFNTSGNINANIITPSYIKRAANSSSWVNGRANALIRETSSSGYHPLISFKTTNGSWEMGHYNASSYHNHLTFSYVTDSDYNAGTNNSVVIRLRSNYSGYILTTGNFSLSGTTLTITTS